MRIATYNTRGDKKYLKSEKFLERSKLFVVKEKEKP